MNDIFAHDEYYTLKVLCLSLNARRASQQKTTVLIRPWLQQMMHSTTDFNNVTNALGKLRVDKATGANGLSPWLLKEIKDIISYHCS